MNHELAVILRDKITGLPFIDLLAGIAQTLSMEETNNDTAAIYAKRYPVSYTAIGDNCKGKEVPLMPDDSKRSIIYFEDYGITATGRLHGQSGFSSRLRLVAWLNRARLVGNHYTPIAGVAMAAIIDTIAGKNPQNIGIFTRLTIDVSNIPAQDAAIFSKYTYKESDRQYLRPPFEFFAIDFTCKYYVPAKCLSAINWNIEKCS